MKYYKTYEEAKKANPMAYSIELCFDGFATFKTRSEYEEWLSNEYDECNPSWKDKR